MNAEGEWMIFTKIIVGWVHWIGNISEDYDAEGKKRGGSSDATKGDLPK